jgi:N-methylhydantoinase B
VFLRNSRTPDHNALNLRGRMASLTVTHRRIHELIEDYGIDTFRAATGEMVDYVEEVVRGRLREMPDGAWFHRIHLDHNGNENELYPICCRISKQGDRLVIDFTGTAEQAPGAVNCARAALEGAVIGVFLMFLCYDLPWSVGAAHRIVEIVSEEGTINNALAPAATSMASISGTLATQAAVANAFAKMLLASDRFRGEAQAEWSSIPNCLVLAGLDRRGEPFATVDMNNCGGGAGARTFADGMDTGGIFHSMGSTIPNVETMESRTPELAVFRRQRADSAGNGRFRGGAGLELLLAPHKNPAPVDHITINAFASQPDNCGLAGGSPAAVNSNVLLRDTDLADLFAGGRVPDEAGKIAGSREVVEAKARSVVARGDAHLYLQTGGGGYGDPLRRDPDAVLVDLRHGLVSRSTAVDIYGVVFDGDAIDAAATAACREEIRRRRIETSEPVRAGAPTPAKAVGGETMHPVADTVEAARVDGEELIRCTECSTRLGAYEEDYKASTLWRERPFVALTPLNEVAPKTSLRAREFCCPGCGTMLAVDISAVGEPPLAECAFGSGAGVPAGGFMELGNDAVEEVQ